MGSDEEPPPLPSRDPLQPENFPSPPPEDHTTMSVMKNSTIPVNVDDLGPGLIVATFTHINGTLYQGVLLQLNRERGIPCGISFPKDYCSTIPSKSTEFESENEQPPVQQRHTYFLTNSNTPPRPLRKFNRATKPPARYKNGRLALRLRHRPVLCSKCRAYCEEKNPPRNARDVTENGESAIPTRRNDSKSKAGDRGSSDNLVSETVQSEGQQSKLILDTEDYAYAVVGPNPGVVENYWKRPNPSELIQQEKTRHSVKTDEKGGGGGMVLDMPKSFLSLTSTDDNQVPAAVFICKSEEEKHISSAFQTKKQNLRFCIKKLQLQKQAVVDNPNPTSSESSSLAVEDVRGILLPVERRSSSDLSSAEEKSRKRSTAVPARFRDATCITKNVFDFKKRRQEGSKVTTGLDLASALTSQLSSPINSSASSNPRSIDEGCPEECPSSSSDVTTTSGPNSHHRRTGVPSTKRQSLNPITSLSDVARTPTIKISYGSSGKGVVIEIPSKPTVEANAPMDDPISLEKAEKKALRKARKQAKRKMSKISEDSGSSSLVPNALSSNSHHELSSSHSSCSSPPPPLLTPISELCAVVPDDDYPISLDYKCPPLIHFTKEIPLSPKKRKKEKKHKRYKERKEDDTLASS